MVFNLPVDRTDQRRAPAHEGDASEVDEEVGIGGLGGHSSIVPDRRRREYPDPPDP